MISLNDLDTFSIRFGPLIVDACKSVVLFGEASTQECGWWLYTFTVQVERKIGNHIVGRFLTPSTRLKQLLEQAGVATEWVPAGDPYCVQGELGGDPAAVLERIREVIASCPREELYFDAHPEQWDL